MRLNDGISARNNFYQAISVRKIKSGLKDGAQDRQVRPYRAIADAVLNSIWGMSDKWRKE